MDSRLRGNDDEKIVVASDKFLPCWVLDSRFCGNDGRVVSVAPDKCRHLKSRHSLKTENRNQKPKIPSFPRRRESRSVGTETYRVKRFLEILRSGFPPARE
ncbi:pilus assembly protein PilS [Neisseria meningitidis]|nr:pilus assembly protein PilS [Neisseria meningitidis]